MSLLQTYSCTQDCCSIDNSLALAQFEENSSNKIQGKNVLIIGASKGIGKATADYFLSKGANVIGTSRVPTDYPATGYLDPVPLDLVDNDSVVNFFATSRVKDWTKIHILILGGIIFSPGYLVQCNASDLFTNFNAEIFGRLGRIVSQCILKMRNVDDSRIIVLSCISGILPTLGTGSLSMVNASLVAWVKQFNMEKQILNTYQHGNPFIKTTAIAFEGLPVKTEPGLYPQTLCPAIIFGPSIYQWQSGSFGEIGAFSLIGTLGIYNNSLTQGLAPVEAAKALLYMSTVYNPEWRYIVMTPGQKWAGKSAECWIKRMLTHKCKDTLTKFVKELNYPVAYYNYLKEGNTGNYSLSVNPSPGAVAPYIAGPSFRPDWPNCKFQDPMFVMLQLDQKKNVCDLISTKCHAPVPCPEGSCTC